MLRDFEGVSEWIRACKNVRPEHVEILAKHEVLRTCEGVGKILLRKPNEIISMTEHTSFTPRIQQNSNGNFEYFSVFNDAKNSKNFTFQNLKVIHYCHPKCLYQTKSDGLSCGHEIVID